MKETLIKGITSFKLLFNFDNYKRSEQVIKILLMPFALVINTILFILVSFFLIIEKVFSYVFRYFIQIQTKLFHKKMQVEINKKKWFTLLSVLVFIVFSPILLIYLLATLFKKLGKYLMRELINAMDFAKNFKDEELLIFDDKAFADMTMNSQYQGLFKDLKGNEALGEALEDYLKNMQEGNDDDLIK